MKITFFKNIFSYLFIFVFIAGIIVFAIFFEDWTIKWGTMNALLIFVSWLVLCRYLSVLSIKEESKKPE